MATIIIFNIKKQTEKLRRSLRIYFLLRSLSLKLRNEEEKFLPLSNVNLRNVAMEECLDLSEFLKVVAMELLMKNPIPANSDLLAVTIVTDKSSTKLRRFLVVDAFQFILVEPSNSR